MIGSEAHCNDIIGKPSRKWKYKLAQRWPRVFNALFGIQHHIHVEVRNKFGVVVQSGDHYNTFTTAGKNGLADQILASPTLGKPTHFGIGTGTPTGTALGAEIDRNALTSKTRINNVVTFVGDWAAGDGTGVITECGIFDASSSGNMWLSATLSPYTKNASDSLSLTHNFTVN